MLRAYRRSSVQILRRERREGVGPSRHSSASDGDEADALEPATLQEIPAEVVELVMAHLDPISLARAACVGRPWRAVCDAEALWAPHLSALPTRHRHPAAGTAELGAAASSKGGGGAGTHGAGGGSSKSRFVAAVRARPRLLLRWKTLRVMVGGAVGWLGLGLGPSIAGGGREGRQQVRHLRPEEAVRWLKNGGKRVGDEISDDDGGRGQPGGGSDGEDAAVALAGLRFWRIQKD